MEPSISASKGFAQYAAPDMRQESQAANVIQRGHGEKAARRLQIYAFDPQLGRRRRYRISLEIPYEQLEEIGVNTSRPSGRLVNIVDYDAAADCHYSLVNLDDPAVLASGGLEPQVDDHKFHQQMVYAVTMKVVANFERALGRRLNLERLTVLPHAFRGRNAFFHPKTNSLAFGYFRADPENPGSNLPGQWIFSCLSHDIVAHEMSHALVHSLRPHFYEATNPDVFAFHEAIADIVAIFQHFGFPGVLAEAVQQGRADLSKPGPLLDLAIQFGYSTGTGAALRSAAKSEPPDPTMYGATFEAHDRGSVLVLAVFDAFFATYAMRVEDLIRIATAGTGVLGEGYLQADLVSRITNEAGDTAQRVLDLCIRAIDYLPPLDVTFSDYLRALVTADTELNPDDPYDLRANLVDAFLARGIHPSGVFSANEESLLWDAPAPSIVADNLDPRVLDILAGHQSEQWGATSKSVGRDWNYVKEKLHDWADGHHAALQMEPDSRCPIEVEGFQSMFRVGSDGQLLTEAGVQFVQTSPAAQPVLGGLVPRAGTTVVFSGDGSARYLMPKPLSLHSDNTPDAGDPRMKALTDFVRECDERDPHYPWVGEAYDPKERMLRRFNFALVHQGIRRTARAKDVSGNGG
jgi:hypothetical protein